MPKASKKPKLDSGHIALTRRLFRENFHEYRWRYALAFLLMGITAGTTALMAWLIRDAVNDVFVAQNLPMVWFFGAAFIAISVVKGFSAYGQTVVLSRIGNSIVARIQRQMFGKLLQLGVGHFGRTHSSQLITRISQNAKSARELMNLVATTLGRDILTLLGLVGVMIVQDPVMTAMTLLIAPPIIIAVVRVVRRVRKLAGLEIQTNAAVIATAQETAQGIRIIKSFTLEGEMSKRVDTVVRGVEDRANKLVALQASTGPLMESLGGVAIGLVILYAGWQTIEVGKSPGEFMSFLVAFLLAYEPAKRLAKLRVQLERTMVGVSMMYELIDTPSEEVDVPDAVELASVEGNVELRDVEFGYLLDEPVLRGVSLEAKKGQVIALVGQSGGGKTTIMNLVERFYTPWSGNILVDGHDIQNVTLASLRKHISFVSQDTFLFTGSIRDNIVVGRIDATEEDVVEAAKAAQAWDFIERLPEGLDTHIGENGGQLSGGQRQRIAIARAILKGAPILLLDEATSALDTQSERKVQAALETLMAGRTTIVIAHRLSTILKANRIYVIQGGRVAESGNHPELLAQNGIYADLYNSAEFQQDDALEDAAQ